MKHPYNEGPLIYQDRTIASRMLRIEESGVDTDISRIHRADVTMRTYDAYHASETRC